MVEAPSVGVEEAPRAGEDEEPSAGMVGMPSGGAEGSPVMSDMVTRERRHRCKLAALEQIVGGGWAAEKGRIRFYTM
jgi:hypothetical protein